MRDGDARRCSAWSTITGQLCWAMTGGTALQDLQVGHANEPEAHDGDDVAGSYGSQCCPANHVSYRLDQSADFERQRSGQTPHAVGDGLGRHPKVLGEPARLDDWKPGLNAKRHAPTPTFTATLTRHTRDDEDPIAFLKGVDT
ncbi:MAG TPA: hypothetical protein PK954_06720 [Anaerolineales bacterium]|nr:hypothetical protein [Anaerolineales bacterium]